MSNSTKTTEAEQGANMFTALVQITRLLHAARINDFKWRYEIDRLRGSDGQALGKCFEDGCTITIRIEPKAPSAHESLAGEMIATTSRAPIAPVG